MPIQAPQWTDYLNCPVCGREFGASPRSPISLGCGHTLCKQCLKNLHKKQCPFDQQTIQVELEELVVNTALLQLAGFPPPTKPYYPPCIQNLAEADRRAYDMIVRAMEKLGLFLKYCGNQTNNSPHSNRLSRPMQRKLVTLLQCAMTDNEGRGRAARAARSLGERTVTELILQHQNPQQLSANLWAAVRARGCQFLGPAMQEEVLKLVLLALEDGSALSRKVLVMFVVQRLEPHFPQASKTSIGHVVQLLYRASCFKVSKRESDSSLMQLKEEFRTYETLRREHDAQIVQIATEAGLRIAPDQWSALLYGDTAHKSHMQSIIDKLQTPQSFAQSVQELFIALQRTGDPTQLAAMSAHLDQLANIDPNPDANNPTWQELAKIMTSLNEVVSGLILYLQQQTNGRDNNHNHNAKHGAERADPPTIQSLPSPHMQYKAHLCRDATSRTHCPRGNACTFAHCEKELERHRMMTANPGGANGNFVYMPMSMPMQPMYPQYGLHPHQQPYENYSLPPPIATVPPPGMQSAEVMPVTTTTDYDSARAVDSMPPRGYVPSMPPPPLGVPMSPMMLIPERGFPPRYAVDEGSHPTSMPPPSMIQPNMQGQMQPSMSGAMQGAMQAVIQPAIQGAMQGNMQPSVQANLQSGIQTPQVSPMQQYVPMGYINSGYEGVAYATPVNEQGIPIPMYIPMQNQRTHSPFSFDERSGPPEIMTVYSPPYTYTASSVSPQQESAWANANKVFKFDEMRNSLPPDDAFTAERRAPGADRHPSASTGLSSLEVLDDVSNKQLEEGLQDLARRIDDELKND